MSKRRSAALAAVLVAVLAAILATAALRDVRPDAAPSSDTAPGTTPGPDASPSSGPAPGTTQGPATGPEPGRRATASSPTSAGAESPVAPTAAASGSPSGAATPASGVEGALEVLPGQPGVSTPPQLGGPATVVAAGDRDEMPVAPRSVVDSRSRSGGAGRVQVALVARGLGRPERVLRFYRIRLGELGYSQREVAAVAGSSAAGFRRGDDSMVVTVAPRGDGGTDYSVLATWGA